ncbi:hypothetical protein EV401DRAFT_1864032, partial [Pisolithus croceorrhizus]
DPSIYSLTPDEAEFLKTVAGINGNDMLRAHILRVQEKAYKMIMAIHRLVETHTRSRMLITKLPVYQDILGIGRERPDALFLDLGCCYKLSGRVAHT